MTEGQRYEGAELDEQVVYIVTPENNPFRVKIGVSNDPMRRVDKLQTGSPKPLTLSGIIHSRDAKKMENQLHERFAEQHTHGEWFDLTIRQKRHLDRLCDVEPGDYGMRRYLPAEDRKRRNLITYALRS